MNKKRIFVSLVLLAFTIFIIISNEYLNELFKRNYGLNSLIWIYFVISDKLLYIITSVLITITLFSKIKIDISKKYVIFSFLLMLFIVLIQFVVMRFPAGIVLYKNFKFVICVPSTILALYLNSILEK